MNGQNVNGTIIIGAAYIRPHLNSYKTTCNHTASISRCLYLYSPGVSQIRPSLLLYLSRQDSVWTAVPRGYTNISVVTLFPWASWKFCTLSTKDPIIFMTESPSLSYIESATWGSCGHSVPLFLLDIYTRLSSAQLSKCTHMSLPTKENLLPSPVLWACIYLFIFRFTRNNNAGLILHYWNIGIDTCNVLMWW